MSDATILAVGGLSESGKTTVGVQFELMGSCRLKIASFYRELHIREGSGEFLEWSKQIDQAEPERISSYVLERTLEEIDKRNSTGATLESLYGDVLAENLRNLHGENFQVLYIDALDSVRSARQFLKGRFIDEQAATIELRARDALKVSWGALRTAEIADHVIQNNSTFESFKEEFTELYLDVFER